MPDLICSWGDSPPRIAALPALGTWFRDAATGDVVWPVVDGAGKYFYLDGPNGAVLDPQPANVLPCDPADASTSGPRVVDRDSVFGCDITDRREVERVTVTFEDGTITETFTYTDDGTEISQASNFTATKPNVSVNIQGHHMFSTNIDPADANYGLSLELERRDTTTDGITETVYLLVEDVTGIGSRLDDVTALVTGGAPWSAPNDEEQLVVYPNVNFDVTGAATAMPAAGTSGRVALAGWMRAELNIDDDASGVRYTTDGTAPTDDNGQLAQEGGVIVLSEDGIVNAQFAPVGDDGLIDAALSIGLSWEQRNRAPEQ